MEKKDFLTTEGRRDLLERFLRYVAVNTRADGSAPKEQVPSFEGERAFNALLASELLTAGATEQMFLRLPDGALIVRFEATAGEEGKKRPCFAAHVDTYPKYPGGAATIQHEYAGGDIALPKDGTVIPAADLTRFIGKRIITASGDTTLGADDKAGVAVMMQLAVDCLSGEMSAHGAFDLWFCVDEEIGRVGSSGVKYLSPEIVASWTGGLVNLDGMSPREIDVGCFCGYELIVKFFGNDAHPGVEGGKLKPAHYAACRLVADAACSEFRLPWTSEAMQNYLYSTDICGNASESRVTFIPRSFVKEDFALIVDRVKEMAGNVAKIFGVRAEFSGYGVQYVNTEPPIRRNQWLMDALIAAHRDVGYDTKENHIRGGTDGAMVNMSYPDLPSPNIGAGMYNVHGPREFLVVEEMEDCYRIVRRFMELLA